MDSRVEEGNAVFGDAESSKNEDSIQRTVPKLVRPPVVSSDAKVIQYADIVMDVAAMTTSRSGRLVKLNGTEFRLLKLLLEQPERAFTREQLKAAIWGRGVKLDLRTINAYLGRLRRALNANGDVNVIRTITGYGYSIDATCSNVR